MNIWAVANQKGGVGKTTTTVTLAGILAERSKKTVVVDLDPHGSLTSYFGINPETVRASVYDLFTEAAEGYQLDACKVVVPTRFESLSIMPASTAMATLEKKLGSRNGMGLVLKQALGQLSEEYEYVLIDCPPMLGMLMVSAVVACDQLIIPVQTEHLAIKGLQRMIRTLDMVGHSLRKKLNYRILPTMYDKRTRASVKSLQQIRHDFGNENIAAVIPIDTQFRDASYEGIPLSMITGQSHGVAAYEAFLYALEEDTFSVPQVAAAR